MVTVNRSLLCTDHVEAKFFSLKKLKVCGWCLEPLNKKNLVTLSKYFKEVYRVVPNCGSLACMSRFPDGLDGWIAKGTKPKNKKRKPSNKKPTARKKRKL